MTDTNVKQIEKIPFGKQGLQVAKISYGGMSLSMPGGEVSTEQGVEVIGTALKHGINLFDTGDFYGCGHNELIFAQAIKKYGRDKFILNVKYGIDFDEKTKVMNFQRGAVGTREFIREHLEASLKRLEIDHIDIFTLARVDPNTPIETSVAAIAELIKEGKVKYIGLSECSAETVRKAHKVHPITCIQVEYSMASTEPEEALLPTCKELGIGFLAYSILGRGLFSGEAQLNENDFRKMFPRFQGENYEVNKQLVAEVAKLAKEKGNYSSCQIAVAWVNRDPYIVCLIGTRSSAKLEENIQALDIKVSDEEEKNLRSIMSKVQGTRYHAHGMKMVDL